MNQGRRFRASPRSGLLIAAVLVAATAAARADQASSALAKYRQPVEQALDKALAFLATQQLKDGSFQTALKGNTAVTSLAVMAFLAKGHTPGVGPWGVVINKGIDFVLSRQRSDGVLAKTGTVSGPMYCHGVSTLMLSEISGMVSPSRQKRLDAALRKALKVILSAQKVKKPASHQGGWRYKPNAADSDISLTGWQLMSLRSARNNGASVPLEAIEQAVKFVMNCRVGDGGFAYTPGAAAGSGLARTGTALLCLELCGRHRNATCAGAAKYILGHRDTKVGVSFFYYGLYYCAQGMFQLGGTEWEQFAVYMYAMMLKFQRKDGSWPQGGSHEGKAGKAYATAMGVLAISVSYRQLPIYQR